MLFGGVVHLDFLKTPQMSIDNPIRLHHKVQTIQLLQDELKNPGKTPLDDIIMTALALAVNEVETVANGINQKIWSPFNPPLSHVQWINIYGSMFYVTSHEKAIVNLVTRRGGLEKIEVEGLAEILSL
jgi:hypothetical protein